MIRSAIAKANSNIALIKYWGKRDEIRNLPMNSSISLTLDSLVSTTTSIQFCESLKNDEFWLDGKKEAGKKLERVKKHLDIIRDKAKIKLKAKVFTENTFPSGAGIASSASGFCALTAAACEALDLNLDAEEQSKIARLGSGSATRSFYSGFVEWNKGKLKSGSDSFAVQLYDKDYWDELRDIIVILSEKEKATSSREGMKKTVKTSKLYKKRIKEIDDRIKELKKAIKKKDKETLFKLIMEDSDEMHSTMLDTKPKLNYLNAVSLKIKQIIKYYNKKKTRAAYSFDAGPNAHIITTASEVNKITDELRKIKSVKRVVVSKLGHGVRTKNTSFSIVKAYGKSLICGGYGILENGTGLVVNINKGTTTRASLIKGDKVELIIPNSGNNKFAVEAVKQARNHLKSKKGVRIESTNDKEMNPRGKAGFGSSATAVVSIVAAILDLHGIDVRSDKGRRLVYDLADKAHNKAQGKLGSGFDISAACFGTQFFSKKSFSKTRWPKNWHSLLAFTGKSSSTPELVKKVFSFKKKNKEEYHKIMNDYNRANSSVKSSYQEYLKKSDNLREIVINLEASFELRKQLGKESGADIETEEHCKLLKQLKDKGALFATLPGAGGGDTILAVCNSKEKASNVRKFLRQKKMLVFDDVEIADKPYEILA